MKALRAALGYDAAPALALLQHDRLEVRVAALATLEFRKDWRPGQAELVLQTAQNSDQPAMRAAAITALGNIEDRHLLELLAEFLRDTHAEVRRAAAEALLWDSERRWTWIRFAVRRLLSDPIFHGDGPLVQESQQAVPGSRRRSDGLVRRERLAVRALGPDPFRPFQSGPERTPRSRPGAVAPPAIGQSADSRRIALELGKLLQQYQELDLLLLRRLLDPSNPAPLRLIACESLWPRTPMRTSAAAPSGPCGELARLPNREIALGTADVIQRRLGVNLGLALGQALPTLQSRQAADIARRVLVWASQYDAQEENMEDSHVVR